MEDAMKNESEFQGIVQEGKRFLAFFLEELKPKGEIYTPFNVISGFIIFLGAILVIIRFAKGLGAVTNLSQDFPWPKLILKYHHHYAPIYKQSPFLNDPARRLHQMQFFYM